MLTFTDKFEAIRKAVKQVEPLAEFTTWLSPRQTRVVTILGNNRKNQADILDALKTLCNENGMTLSDQCTIGKVKFVIEI